jgi:hypothetical protein
MRVDSYVEFWFYKHKFVSYRANASVDGSGFVSVWGFRSTVYLARHVRFEYNPTFPTRSLFST